MMNPHHICTVVYTVQERGVSQTNIAIITFQAYFTAFIIVLNYLSQGHAEIHSDRKGMDGC